MENLPVPEVENMRFRLVAAAALGAALALPVSPASAFEATLFRVTPAGNIVGESVGSKPSAGVLHPERQPWQTAQATQDRRTEPPTAPGQKAAPTTTPSVTPPPAPGFAPSDWGAVLQLF